MPGVFPVIGRTEAEAQEIFAELNRNIDTAQAFTVLSERLGADMSVHPLDGPVPVVPETEHLKSRAALLIEMARREKLTLRQLYYRVAAARGHLLLIGTGAEIADVLEAWFRAGAADGFNVMPPFFPGQFDAFVDRGRAAPAGARPVPRRLHRHDAARSPRAEASGSGVHRSPVPHPAWTANVIRRRCRRAETEHAADMTT